MSLTGPVFLDGLVVLTIAAFVAVVLLWPHLTPRTPWHVAARAGALVGLNLLVLMTAATQLNAAYLFFAGWADLRQATTGHLTQTTLHRGAVERRTPDVAVSGRAAPVLAQVPPLGRPVGPGGVVSWTVHGPLSGLTGTVLVSLPPGYTAPAAAHRRYPVLEAFHGYPNDPWAWVRTFHVRPVVDRVTAAHRLGPTIVVMPQVEFPAGVDTEGVNGPPGTPQVETWLTRDVPTWVGQHLRVVANRDAWATIGYSAGGWNAAMATILHPAQYGSAIVLGGYFRPDFGALYEPFTASSARGRYYDLPLTVAHHPPPVAVWVETSHADPLSYSTSVRFLRATRAPMAVHAVVLRDAGHRLSVWRGVLPGALQWLGQTARGFHP